ncbi:ATP-dependent DNA ligase [Luteolibacter arcticus]|uniref:DNA ligase n=1 Tax=Luteolibacter arcticus TaxID=1581411 RepID=A0ABT3GSG4_9BACT|nr:ATP-dependent DNA ligase [Luteolibacter arcticus]MCW1926474.1 ATP-dependent DNA ligase [Luteolibacter arcticus]
MSRASVIEVRFQRGLHLPELDLWLDPWDPKPWAFVSHAHADHFARHETALCSAVTGALVRSRYGVAESRIDAVAFHAPIVRDGFRLRLLPAGHIAGSAMLHVTRVSDGATLLYTGDFKVRKGRTAEPVVFQQADLLILETTFGLPQFTFPPAMEVEGAVLRFVHDTLADGEVPVLLGYSLGKAQEALALLHAHDIPAVLHPSVAEMTAACRAAGVTCLPELLVLGEAGNLPSAIYYPPSAIPPGHAVIAPPNAVRSKLLRAVGNRRVAMLSGWALVPGATFRYRVDEAIPLSDHADYPGLMECLQRVRPKKILTVHGYTREFAAELRLRGYDAWSIAGNDQLDLPLAAPPVRNAASSGIQTTASARHVRPICALADFTSVCRLVGETSSRLEKIRHLAAYLRGLDNENDLALAARWLTGRALPRDSDRRAAQTGGATLRRALLKLPGVREERYREISLSQNDAARTTRLLLQELSLKPEALDLAGLAAFFQQLATATGSLARIDLLAERLRTLHPAEGETLVKLLTGDLRIGLKEGLVEDALAEAFSADPPAVRSAHMLTGDLGETARLAKRKALTDATLRPFVPVKVMLASPMPDAAALVVAASSSSNSQLSTPNSQPLWLEPKYDGIRAQLHKQADRAALYSRDLRPLDGEFPELLAAALSIPGDFILDGEIIAHAEGRRLTFHDLQTRLGKISTAQADLFSATSASIPPVLFVAFDLLHRDGTDLLTHPLAARRALLESAISHPPSAISIIAVRRIEADAETVQAAFKQARSEGHEGLIAKDPASLYSPGRRGRAWLKLKTSTTLDCIVVAAEQGHGKRAEVLSDYTFAVRDETSGQLKIIGKAYSGLTDVEIEELTDHFQRHTLSKDRRKHLVEPNLVLEIAFDSIQASKRHDSGLAMRFPRIHAIRRDKTIADIDTLQYARSLVDG